MITSHIKEKQYIKFIDDKGKESRLDLNLGGFVGKKGQPLKTVPSGWKTYIHHCWAEDEENLLLTYLDDVASYSKDNEGFYERISAKRLSLAERLDVINIHRDGDNRRINIYWMSADEVNLALDNFKLFTKLIKSMSTDMRINTIPLYQNGTMTELDSKFTLDECKDFIAITRDCADYFDIPYTSEEFKNILHLITYTYTRELKDFVNKIAIISPTNNVVQLGTVEEPIREIKEIPTINGSIHYYLSDFYRNMIALYKFLDMPIPKKESDICRAYTELVNSAKEKQKQAEIECYLTGMHLAETVFKQEEDSPYIIIAPTCKADLVTEGAKMHHCVGGYHHAIKEGRELVFFLRKKENPTEPYITFNYHKYCGDDFWSVQYISEKYNNSPNLKGRPQLKALIEKIRNEYRQQVNQLVK